MQYAIADSCAPFAANIELESAFDWIIVIFARNVFHFQFSNFMDLFHQWQCNRIEFNSIELFCSYKITVEIHFYYELHNEEETHSIISQHALHIIVTMAMARQQVWASDINYAFQDVITLQFSHYIKIKPCIDGAILFVLVIVVCHQIVDHLAVWREWNWWPSTSLN